jgi:hypothetical protein
MHRADERRRVAPPTAISPRGTSIAWTIARATRSGERIGGIARMPFPV